MEAWLAVRYLHLLALAFFVGGQLVLVVAVVPAAGGGRHPEAMRAIARRFGWGSLAALVALLVTGAAMAEHFGRWSDTKLQLKLALVTLAGALVLWHIRAPDRRILDGAMFVVSLIVVWLGVALAH